MSNTTTDDHDVSTTGGADDTTKESAEEKMTYWQQLRAELFHGHMFSDQEANGRLLDLDASFAPKPKGLVFLIKLLLFAWVLSVMIHQVLVVTAPSFYAAYLTTWALFITILYMLLSLLLTALSPSLTMTAAKEEEDEQTFTSTTTTSTGAVLRLLQKLAWATFSVAACLQLQVTVLFWVNPSAYSYLHIMVHGVVLVLLLLEGLGINRVPVQARQIVWVEGVMLLYMVWTIVHSLLLEIGNPEKPYDEIYPIVDWKPPHTLKTFLLACGILLLTTPLSFLLIRHLSLLKRRYHDVCKSSESDAAPPDGVAIDKDTNIINDDEDECVEVEDKV